MSRERTVQRTGRIFDFWPLRHHQSKMVGDSVILVLLIGAPEIIFVADYFLSPPRGGTGFSN